MYRMVRYVVRLKIERDFGLLERKEEWYSSTGAGERGFRCKAVELTRGAMNIAFRDIQLIQWN